VENSVDNVEKSVLSSQFSLFSPFYTGISPLYKPMYRFHFLRVFWRYVSGVTTCFISHFSPKSLNFISGAPKNPTPRQKTGKIFVELSQISFSYENSPTGDTGNIFIFQEGVCRARWKSAV
jgi:hypothetical protein